jgi:perosamine synthetase
MSTLSQVVTESIQRALNHPKEFVSLHEPRFSGNESKYVLECINSTFVSSVGKFVDRLENDLREYTGAKYVVAVTNGTAALHMALLLAGVESGDEILVPALTFVATANAVRYCGAFPHFVDSEESGCATGILAIVNRTALRKLCESYYRKTYSCYNSGSCFWSSLQD